MGISKEEVRRVARLAHLEYPRVQQDGVWVEPEHHLIQGPELARLAEELGKILDHVRELEQVDTSGVEPTLHGVPLPTRFRDDLPVPTPGAERLLAAAPERIGDGVAVPKIVE